MVRAGARGECVEVPGFGPVIQRVDAVPEESVTFWSGAQAFRTRWRRDRASLEWSCEGLIGGDTTDGDVFRFDPETRMLRECVLSRPARVLFDGDVWRELEAVAEEPGTLMLAGTNTGAGAAMDLAMFDLDLTALVALREDALGADFSAWQAVRVADRLSILFDADGAYAGWRVRDPVAAARPMGWPDVRDEAPAEDPWRGRLATLLYDWMCIDASPRVRPDLAVDPEEIAHMVALRARARELAESAEHDAVAGVARDVAAHVHWSWGFFRVGE